MIETERLLMRHFEEADAAALFFVSKDLEVGREAGWKPHESLKETREVLEEVFLRQEDIFAIVLKENGRLIGSIGLMADNHRQNADARMLGYALGKEFWGQGYATEASRGILAYGFLEKGYPLISVTHFTYNTPSERVILKSGFQREGILRQGEKRFDGIVLDLACYSLTKGEFLAQNNKD